MKVPLGIHLRELILIIFFFFIFLEGHSKLVSESYYDNVHGLGWNNPSISVAAVNPTHDFEKISSINVFPNRKNSNALYPITTQRKTSIAGKKRNNILITEVKRLELLTDSLESEGGKLVQIFAEPEIGYLFNHWTLNGEFLSSAVEYEFQMPFEDTYIIGHFDKIEPATINVISPMVNSSFSEGEKIDLSADVKSDKGEISKVDFFVDGSLLASFTNSPYEFTWENATPGEHQIVVKAVDNSGQISASNPRKF
ncbi:Ig-like domain-containing protein, partial [Algoriphagus resistens]|uniref:Ig-like domain-containing protein n=1 Tax=Algoriphagus resistens TaxID=1750590 RepID=UPI000A6A55D5